MFYATRPLTVMLPRPPNVFDDTLSGCKNPEPSSWAKSFLFSFVLMQSCDNAMANFIGALGDCFDFS